MVVLRSAPGTFRATELQKHAVTSVLSGLTNVMYIRRDRVEFRLPELAIDAFTPQVIGEPERALGAPVVVTQS